LKRRIQTEEELRKAKYNHAMDSLLAFVHKTHPNLTREELEEYLRELRKDEVFVRKVMSRKR
jgi:hypothetical protein